MMVSPAACADRRQDAPKVAHVTHGNPPAAPVASVPVLDGVWTGPIAGFSPGALEANQELLVIGGLAGGAAQVRAARWNGSELVFEDPIPIPLPPWAEDSGRSLVPHPTLDDADPTAMAVARLDPEFSGGEGIAVFADLRVPGHVNIESPVDSDMQFGAPLVLRGPELFTFGPSIHGSVWHYTRGAGAAFVGKIIALPPDVDDVGDLLALARDRATLALTTHSGERHRLEFYARAGGAFVHAQAVELPGQPTGASFVGDELVVGFMRPAPDGTAVWIFARTDGLWVPTRRVHVPPVPQNQTRVHELDAFERWAVVVQLDALFVLDLERGAVACELRLPDPEVPGRLRRPRATMMGPRVVAMAGGRLGVYELATCATPAVNGAEGP